MRRVAAILFLPPEEMKSFRMLGMKIFLFALSGLAHIYTMFFYLFFFFKVIQLLSFASSRTDSIRFNEPRDLALLHHVCTLLGAACGGHWRCGAPEVVTPNCPSG